MRLIRVLLLDVTGMAGDIVRQILSHHDDVEIVASIPDVNALESVPEIAEVDVVITSSSRNQPDLGRVDRVLAARPRVRVLAVEDDGRTASVYMLRPHRTELGPLSPETLIASIRASRHDEPAWTP